MSHNFVLKLNTTLHTYTKKPSYSSACFFTISYIQLETVNRPIKQQGTPHRKVLRRQPGARTELPEQKRRNSVRRIPLVSIVLYNHASAYRWREDGIMALGVVWMHSVGHVCGNEEAVQITDGGGREEGRTRKGGERNGQ